MFWLTIAILGMFWGGDINSSEGILIVALFVLAAFISVLIHEMGHALMIRKFGLPTEVTLTTMGGYATHPAGVLSRKQSFMVTAAGPAIQLAFGVAVLYLSRYLPVENTHMATFVRYLVVVSIFWALFNCLPIFPLDGGQMLSAVLGPRRVKGLHMTGIVCAVLVGLYGFASGGGMFIGLFMAMFAWQNYQMLQQHR